MQLMGTSPPAAAEAKRLAGAPVARRASATKSGCESDLWLQIFANFKVKMQKSSKVPKYKIQPKYQNMTVFC